jgi:hypothetical protein
MNEEARPGIKNKAAVRFTERTTKLPQGGI